MRSLRSPSGFGDVVTDPLGERVAGGSSEPTALP